MAFRVELLLLLVILVSLSFGSVDSDDGESFHSKSYVLFGYPQNVVCQRKKKTDFEAGLSESEKNFSLM